MNNPAPHEGTNGRADVPSAITVVRENDAARQAAGNGSRRGHWTTDDDRRVLRELSDGIRDAFVADRIAGVMAQELAPDVSREVRRVTRARLDRELRSVLQAAAKRSVDAREALVSLNTRLSDALCERLRTVLADAVPRTLHQHLPGMLQTALAGTEFAATYGNAAADAFVDRLLAFTGNAMRQRLDDGLRDVVRIRIGDAARKRLVDALGVTAGWRVGDGDAASIAATLSEEIEESVHDRLVRGVLERFRVIVRNSLHEASAERLRDAVQYATRGDPQDASPHPAQQAAQRPGSRHDTHAGRRGGVDRRCAAGTLDRLANAVEGPIAEEVIARVAEGLRDRLDATVRSNLNAVLRERLTGAIRIAVVEQARAEVVDVDRLADMIHYELAEIIHDRICDGVRARTAEAVHERLDQAIRTGIARAAFT